MREEVCMQRERERERERGRRYMGHNERPLFELIIEESRRKAWAESKGSHGEVEEAAAGAADHDHHLANTKNSPPPMSKKKDRSGGSTWFSRARKANRIKDIRAYIDHTSRGSDPSTCKCSSTSEYESANDSFSSSAWASSYGAFNLNIEELQGQVGLPCLQHDGEHYLEVAMALDMMELRVAQACTERDAALAQALDLRLAMDSMCNRLHQVEQYCLHLNYQLFMKCKGRQS